MKNIAIKGFTLIELLIVVAIIAILAAIAVPNFLEAQIRAKVSRAKSDMRTIHTGLEAYKIDTNKYPKCNGSNWCFASEAGSGGTRNTPTLERLTTPISYLNGKGNFYDPFNPKSQYEGTLLQTKTDLPAHENRGLMWYTARNYVDSSVWYQNQAQDSVDPVWWFLQASGPDATFDLVYAMINPMTVDNDLNRNRIRNLTIYDPTNGSVSRGSLWRVGGIGSGAGTSFYQVLVQNP